MIEASNATAMVPLAIQTRRSRTNARACSRVRPSAQQNAMHSAHIAGLAGRDEMKTMDAIANRAMTRPRAGNGLRNNSNALAQVAMAAAISMPFGFTEPNRKNASGVSASTNPVTAKRLFVSARRETTSDASNAAHASALIARITRI